MTRIVRMPEMDFPNTELISIFDQRTISNKSYHQFLNTLHEAKTSYDLDTLQGLITKTIAQTSKQVDDLCDFWFTYNLGVCPTKDLPQIYDTFTKELAITFKKVKASFPPLISEVFNEEDSFYYPQIISAKNENPSSYLVFMSVVVMDWILSYLHWLTRISSDLKLPL